MGVKRSLRRISIHHLNVLVYCTIAGLVITYHHEIWWSVKVTPRYKNERIPSPSERALYKGAQRLLISDLDHAELMLKHSLEIDPNCEAGFWLAECYQRQGKLDEALTQYQKYQNIDPTITKTYVEASQLYREKGDLVNARRMLQEGLTYFQDNVVNYTPHLDQSVDSKYNEKAKKLHRYYIESERFLRERIRRLEVYGR